MFSLTITTTESPIHIRADTTRLANQSTPLLTINQDKQHKNLEEDDEEESERARERESV